MQQPGGIQAIIFDVDGTIADTERDGHRVAYNRAFAEARLPVSWDPAIYRKYLAVGGGKERLAKLFAEPGFPVSFGDPEATIRDLHARKTAAYIEIVRSGGLPLRQGVRRLAAEARDAGLKLGVASTSAGPAVEAVIEYCLGPDIRFDVVLAGDIVPRKKPDPAIYLLTAERLGLEPSACAVIEDSAIGLAAAKDAGMTCIVAVNEYTAEDDVSRANLAIDSLGEPDAPPVTVLHNPAGLAVHHVDLAIIFSLAALAARAGRRDSGR